MRRSVPIKIILTLILFIVLFKKLNIQELSSSILSLNFKYLALSMAVVPILYIIRSYRWGLLLKSLGVDISFISLCKVLWIGVFYGLITPGKVGELARAYYLDEKISITISTILMEKLIDVLVLASLSLITLTIFFKEYVTLNYIILIGALASVLITGFLANKRLLSLFAGPFKIKHEDVERCADGFSRLRNNNGVMHKTILLAFLYYFVNYILAILILYSLNANAWAVVALPLIILMGSVPITISGLGVRESIGAICFVLLGESGSQGVLFSLLLFIIITLIPGILGYIMVIKYKNCHVVLERM